VSLLHITWCKAQLGSQVKEKFQPVDLALCHAKKWKSINKTESPTFCYQLTLWKGYPVLQIHHYRSNSILNDRPLSTNLMQTSDQSPWSQNLVKEVKKYSSGVNINIIYLKTVYITRRKRFYWYKNHSKSIQIQQLFILVPFLQHVVP
jgi:hypothetical protein